MDRRGIPTAANGRIRKGADSCCADIIPEVCMKCAPNLLGNMEISAFTIRKGACWLDRPQVERLTITLLAGMCFGGITLTMFHLGNWRVTCGESLNIIQ